MEWEKFEECKGPKPAECGKFEIKNSQNMSDVVFLVDFPRDCPATSVGILIKIFQKKITILLHISVTNFCSKQAKIVVSTRSNNVTKKLWNYALNKPCEHFVLGPVLVDSFNLTKNCKVNKVRFSDKYQLIPESRRKHKIKRDFIHRVATKYISTLQPKLRCFWGRVFFTASTHLRPCLITR